jgi:hypothetical protein
MREFLTDLTAAIIGAVLITAPFLIILARDI